ncbi:876_t:CDS:2, partial [Racocetra fulgida]
MQHLLTLREKENTMAMAIVIQTKNKRNITQIKKAFKKLSNYNVSKNDTGSLSVSQSP